MPEAKKKLNDLKLIVSKITKNPINKLSDYRNNITSVNNKVEDIRNDKMNRNVNKDITISTVNTNNNNMNIYKFFPKIKLKPI